MINAIQWGRRERSRGARRRARPHQLLISICPGRQQAPDGHNSPRSACCWVQTLEAQEAGEAALSFPLFIL